MKTKKVRVSRYVEPNEILESNINARFLKINYKYDDTSTNKYISVLLSKGDYVRNSTNASIEFNENGTLFIGLKKVYITNYELIY